jgi:hypothetical protein
MTDVYEKLATIWTICRQATQHRIGCRNAHPQAAVLPEEAQIATALTMMPEPVAGIAARAGHG